MITLAIIEAVVTLQIIGTAMLVILAALQR